MKKINFYILLVVIFLVSFIVSLSISFMLTPNIKVSRLEDIVLGSNYKIPKYNVSMFGVKINKECYVTNNINKDRVGSYYIDYKVNNFIFSRVKRVRVNVIDNEAPLMELNGISPMYVYVGDEYIDAGVKAVDNYDGDITSHVEVVNRVDTNKIGTYEVSYSVQDSSLNSSTINREVRVIERGTTRAGVIYLTFDDGPSNTITSKLLDILKEEGVSATFFVIHHDSSLQHLIKREFDEGHTVALHSYTHDYKTIYSSVDAFYDDFDKIKKEVKNIIGEDVNLFRFPGGGSNTVSRRYMPGIMSILTDDIVKRGYHYFDWNISSGDAGEVKSSVEVYNNVVRQLSKEKENVILMHDFENNYYTLNALRDIIKYAKNNGYVFDKITMSTDMVHHSVAN